MSGLPDDLETPEDVEPLLWVLVRVVTGVPDDRGLDDCPDPALEVRWLLVRVVTAAPLEAGAAVVPEDWACELVRVATGAAAPVATPAALCLLAPVETPLAAPILRTPAPDATST